MYDFDSSITSHSLSIIRYTHNFPYSLCDAVCLIDAMSYLTALAKTDLLGHHDYSDWNSVEMLFQTYTMRIGRFHLPTPSTTIMTEAAKR